ncbi:hypothetical protein GJ632_14675 [Halogeometricum sp. CBA1124]|nr:hypothetical protein [Halogeometricum sp. CBA1124]
MSRTELAAGGVLRPPSDAAATSPAALGTLLAANLVPLVGVLALGWNVFDVLAVYWVESGVVGVLNVPKVLLASGRYEGDATFSIDGSPIDVSGPDDADPDAGPRVHPSNVFPAAFFCLHYGVFWVVHGAFVLFGLPAFAGVPVGIASRASPSRASRWSSATAGRSRGTTSAARSSGPPRRADRWPARTGACSSSTSPSSSARSSSPPSAGRRCWSSCWSC